MSESVFAQKIMESLKKLAKSSKGNSITSNSRAKDIYDMLKVFN